MMLICKKINGMKLQKIDGVDVYAPQRSPENQLVSGFIYNSNISHCEATLRTDHTWQSISIIVILARLLLNFTLQPLPLHFLIVCTGSLFLSESISKLPQLPTSPYTHNIPATLLLGFTIICQPEISVHPTRCFFFPTQQTKILACMPFSLPHQTSGTNYQFIDTKSAPSMHSTFQSPPQTSLCSAYILTGHVIERLRFTCNV